MTKKYTKKEKNLFYKIAAKTIYNMDQRGDLDQHFSDEEDFLEISIWDIEAAIAEAYRQGQNSVK